MYGMKIQGESKNLILGNDSPLLIAMGRGSILVTSPGASIWWNIFNGATPAAAHFGYCDVNYPSQITTLEPPFVFGVPKGNANGGMGAFTHKGSPGAWTGFRVLYVPVLTYAGGYTPSAGTDTGWEYYVCSYGYRAGSESYGLRLWDANAKIVFDSTWDVVPFRTLLTSWGYHSGGKYGGNDVNNNHYWGNSAFNDNYANDTAYEVYQHPWGAANGSLGVLISSLSALGCVADTGASNRTFVTAPMVGFLGASRTMINASVMFGVIQHASTVYPSMNSFALMTADFTNTL